MPRIVWPLKRKIMKVSTENLTVVITGAGSGIGRALALEFAKNGSPVAISDRDESTLQETAAQITGPVHTRCLDVTNRSDFLAYASEVNEWTPTPIAAVINNAGIGVFQTSDGADIEADDRVMRVNYDGVVNGCQAFLPILKAQNSKSALVNISSIAGFLSGPGLGSYCASKAAVRAYTDCMRADLHGSNVTAFSVHPGFVGTNIFRATDYRSAPLEGVDQDETIRLAESLARTTPAKAAQTIKRGVNGGKRRILVGRDAYLLDLIARGLPATHPELLMHATQVSSKLYKLRHR